MRRGRVGAILGLSYCLALAKVGLPGWFPDLLLLVVITLGVAENERWALIAASIIGLLVDAGRPQYLGTHMLTYLLVAQGTTSARRFFTARHALPQLPSRRWRFALEAPFPRLRVAPGADSAHETYIPLFAASAWVVQFGIWLLLSHPRPVFWHSLIAGVSTVALAIPAYRLLKAVFGYQWKVA